MFIRPPVERARVKRQLRATTTTAQSPFESFVSNIINPGSPTTSTRASTATNTKVQPQLPPSESATTVTISPSLIPTSRTLNPSTSSSTGSLSPSTQRTTSSTSVLPLVTAEDSSNSSSQSTVIVTQTASSPSPTGSGTSDASNNGVQGGTGNMTPLVKGIVISASVIFGLIFFALVIRKLFQFRRRQKRVSWADNISPFAPTAHETGYEKPLPQEPAPALTPAPRLSTRYGSQDVGYGPIMGAGRPSFGVNPDQRNSRYSTTGTSYETYQNQPAQLQTVQPYVPAAPYAYNPAGMRAGAAAAAVGGPSGLAYNSNNTVAASPPEMPNPFIVSPVDAAGPVPISVPGAPPATGQQILVVKRTFMPNLEDELSIAAGESVRILAVFDDGWCKVRKLGAGGEEGVVPYECLDNPPAGAAKPGLGTAEER